MAKSNNNNKIKDVAKEFADKIKNIVKKFLIKWVIIISLVIIIIALIISMFIEAFSFMSGLFKNKEEFEQVQTALEDAGFNYIPKEDLEKFYNLEEEIYTKIATEKMDKVKGQDFFIEGSGANKQYYINVAIEKSSTTETEVTSKIETKLEDGTQTNISINTSNNEYNKTASNQEQTIIKVPLKPLLAQFISSWHIPAAFYLDEERKDFAMDIAETMVNLDKLQFEVVPMEHIMVQENTNIPFSREEIRDENTNLISYTDKTGKETVTTYKKMNAYIIKSLEVLGISYEWDIKYENVQSGSEVKTKITKTQISNEINTKYFTDKMTKYGIVEDDFKLGLYILCQNNQIEGVQAGLSYLVEHFPNFIKINAKNEVEKLTLNIKDIEFWEYILYNESVPNWDPATGGYVSGGTDGLNTIGDGSGWWFPIAKESITKSAKITDTFMPSNRVHYGVDIWTADLKNTVIIATRAGTVIHNEFQDSSNHAVGAGLYITIDHLDGTYSVYMHCDKTLVQNGQKVEQGQAIAYMGNTGDVQGITGIHLHFEIRIGSNSKSSAVDPLLYVSLQNPYPVILDTSININSKISMSRAEFIELVRNYKSKVSSNKYTSYEKFFINYAGDFYDIADKNNLNAAFIISIGFHESNFGTSRIANDKNNLFGYGAYDGSAYESAWTFSTPKDGIEQVCKDFIATFLNPSNWKYQKSVSMGISPGTIQFIGVHYASDGSWAKKVASHMSNLLLSK